MRGMALALLFFMGLLEAALATPMTDTAVRADAGYGAPMSPQPDKSCQDRLEQSQGKSSEQIEQSLKNELAVYLPLVEQSLAYRAESIKLATRLKEKRKKKEPLSGDDLDRLNAGTLAHLNLRKGLYVLAEAHECWLSANEKSLKSSGITPAIRLKGVMLSLSSALVLYDNYLLAISIFEEDGKLRRVLNERDSGYEKGSAELAKITLSYNSATNRHRVRSALNFYESEIKKMPPAFFQGEGVSYMNLLITQSPSYAMTKAFSPVRLVGRKINFLSSVTGDVLKNLQAEGINLFSMAFGNTVGLIEARKGKLYKRLDLMAEVERNLEAGDILLEKTPFRLSDRFIPGHWGHAAVWLGTEAELKSLGIWDNPLLVKHHGAIAEGRGVVEAVRSGVEMNSLARFMNIDDLAILRKRDMTRAERIDVILMALRQVGKAYDFNFDVETTDRIVCSELVYMTYTGIKWPTVKTLGRSTISPDNIATKAFEKGPLDLVMLCHDGNQVSNEPLALMKRLVGNNVPVAQTESRTQGVGSQETEFPHSPGSAANPL